MYMVKQYKNKEMLQTTTNVIIDSQTTDFGTVRKK